MSTKKTKKPDARTRILETAERLFYAEGIRAVGIDRIIAEAEVAKMTLYNHFASKDDLILEVLRLREQNVVDQFQTSIAKHMRKGLGELEAFFATLRSWFASRGFRGCSFINASVELADATHQASRFAARHKESFREMLRGIIADAAGEKTATEATAAVSLLVEGAIVTALIEGNPNAADVARDAALKLISTKKNRKV